MSLMSTIKAMLFETPTNPANSSPPTPTQPCRYRLDNDTSATLTLPDGRKLGYAQYGSLTGKPILYHHGFPGSRIEAASLHDIASEFNLRIIALDRPGIGWSSPNPTGTLLDWPKDVQHLTEHLALNKYSVMGISGGGPSALACAYALPAANLTSVCIVCGTGPPDIGMRGADVLHQISWPYGIRFAPYFLARWFWRSMAIGRTDLSEAQRLALLLKEVSAPRGKDGDIFAYTDRMRLTVRASDQAFKQGYDGVWDDGKRSCRPWGFRVQDIRRDLRVQLWYGREDVYVPLLHGVQIAARLGGSAELRVEEESHAGIGVHWKREILEGLRDAMD